jgi:probable rRNA maturation factor
MPRFEIEIANLQSEVDFDDEFIYDLVRFVLESERVKEAEVSIAFVSEEEMKRINEEFRNKPEPTDVLSFLYDVHPRLSGEIILCPKYISSQAEAFSNDFKKELVLIIIHGMLHILGYDHEKSEKEAELMWRRQSEIEQGYWNLFSTS